jgi:hypothetical protein
MNYIHARRFKRSKLVFSGIKWLLPCFYPGYGGSRTFTVLRNSCPAGHFYRLTPKCAYFYPTPTLCVHGNVRPDGTRAPADGGAPPLPRPAGTRADNVPGTRRIGIREMVKWKCAIKMSQPNPHTIAPHRRGSRYSRAAARRLASSVPARTLSLSLFQKSSRKAHDATTHYNTCTSSSRADARPERLTRWA